MILLDTTVLIDHLRGHAPAHQWLAGLAEPPACSEVSRIEVLQGLRPAERTKAEALFRALTWVPVDEAIARRAGDIGSQFRSSHGLSLADLVIGATALELDLPLATQNVRHFPMFQGLRPAY